MLTTTQQKVVFALVCAFTVLAVGVEVYLVHSIIDNGFTDVKAVLTVLDAGVLFLFAKRFVKIVDLAFFTHRITPEQLQRFAAQRNVKLDNARQSGEGPELTRQNLIVNSLEFCEECLKGWAPGHHFELCVFVDRELPMLFAYFDSNGTKDAKSMPLRKANPRFYVEHGYEVVKLLQAPTSQPRVLSDTHDVEAHYAFISNQQRDQIKSTVLYCIDVTSPCALVVSSNERNAFKDSERELIAFIKFIGALVRYDLFQDDFARNVRAYYPDYFPARH
jgi:hypothetical protein